MAQAARRPRLLAHIRCFPPRPRPRRRVGSFVGRPTTDRTDRARRTVATTEQPTSSDNPSPSPSTASDFGANEWLVEDMYERVLTDPGSVDAAWHDFFADYRPGRSNGAAKAQTQAQSQAQTPAPAQPEKPAP